MSSARNSILGSVIRLPFEVMTSVTNLPHQHLPNSDSFFKNGFFIMLVSNDSSNDSSSAQEVSVKAAFLVDATVYAMVGCVTCVQLVRNCCRYRPWTVQKMIHLLMFIATLGKLLICSFT